MRERIVILDGAMGTMVQRHKLTEEQFRGARFAKHPAKDLKGALELLQLTKPEVIEEIHTQYLDAGADIIETNTFSGTTIGLHDFLFPGEPENGRKDEEFFQRVVDDPELVALVHEMNVAAAQLARTAADRVANQTGQPRFVAGSLGPLPVTASLSPDVNDPAFARSPSISFAKPTASRCAPCWRARSTCFSSKRSSTRSTPRRRSSRSRKFSSR